MAALYHTFQGISLLIIMDTIIREYYNEITDIPLRPAVAYPVGVEAVYIRYKAADWSQRIRGQRTEYVYVGAVVTKRVLP